jgi:hypothetical protein
VGGDVKYEVDGDKGKLKTTAGKEVKCTILRSGVISLIVMITSVPFTA